MSEVWVPNLGLDAKSAPAVMDALAALEGQALSPVGADILEVALSVIEYVFDDSIQTVVATIQDTLSDALSSVLDEVLGVVADVAGIIPIVGAFIGIVIDVIKGILAADAATQQANERGCIAVTRRPITPHWASHIYPADIFVQGEYDIKTLLAAGGLSYREMTWLGDVNPMETNRPEDYLIKKSGNLRHRGTLLGDTLIAATESPYVPNNDPAYYLCPDDTEYGKILTNWKAKYYTWAVKQSWWPNKNGKRSSQRIYTEDVALGMTGLSSARRKMYQRLRKGIQAQAGRGDGGELLWTLYVDSLNADYRAGRFNVSFSNYLLTHSSTNGGQRLERISLRQCKLVNLVGSNGTYSKTNALEQVVKILDGWHNDRVAPVMDREKSESIAVQQKINAALASLDAKPQDFIINPIALQGFMRQKEQRLSVKQRAPLNLSRRTVESGGGGLAVAAGLAAVGGVGWYLWKRHS